MLLCVVVCVCAGAFIGFLFFHLFGNKRPLGAFEFRFGGDCDMVWEWQGQTLEEKRQRVGDVDCVSIFFFLLSRA